MEEQGKDNPSPGLPSGGNVNMERPQPTTIEERQVANAVDQLRGEFAGSSAIREEDIKKAVEQASDGTSASEPAKPAAQEETLHNFGRIRTDEKGNPNPEDLPDSVKAVKNPENIGPGEVELRGLSMEERARMEAEREYRRAERIHSDEILYYSPEQVGLLLIRRIDTALVYLQEHGEYPSEFNYGAQRELAELRKVIEAQEEMLFLTPEERVLRGYPEFTIDDLIRMDTSGKAAFLGAVADVDRLLVSRRTLRGQASLDQRQQTQFEKVEELLGEQARVAGGTTETLERVVLTSKQRGIETILPDRIEELKKYERVLLGFADLLEFSQLQRDIRPSAPAYAAILQERNKSQRGKDPPSGMDYRGIFEAPSVIEGTPELGDLIDVAFKATLDVLGGKTVTMVPKIVDGQTVYEKEVERISFKDPLFGKEAREVEVVNIFANEPSDASRWALMEYVKRALFEWSGGSLDVSKAQHQLVVETAVRLALFFVNHWDIDASHAIKPGSAPGEFSLEVTYSDMSKMHFPAVRAINELREVRAPFGNNMFTGTMPDLTSNFLRICSLSLKETERSAEYGGRINSKTGKPMQDSLRISLWDLLTEYGLRLRDIPWTNSEVSWKDLPEEAQRELSRITYKGEEREWEEKLSGSRIDAFMIPYALQMDYIGEYYGVMLARKQEGNFAKLAMDAMHAPFWEGLNKPLDTAFTILLGSRGLSEETVFKLKVLAKVNMAASIIASVEGGMKLTLDEQRALRGGGRWVRTMNLDAYFRAIFDSGFLQRDYGRIELSGKQHDIRIPDAAAGVLRGRKPLAPKIRRFVEAVADKKRGLVPGDSFIRDLFTPQEIRAIEESRLYAPFSLYASKKQMEQAGIAMKSSDPDPVFILKALIDARDRPKARA